jgi:hypothetical protein
VSYKELCARQSGVIIALTVIFYADLNIIRFTLNNNQRILLIGFIFGCLSRSSRTLEPIHAAQWEEKKALVDELYSRCSACFVLL